MARGLHKRHLATHKPRRRMNLQNFMKGEIVKRHKRDKLRSSFSLSHSLLPSSLPFFSAFFCLSNISFPKFLLPASFHQTSQPTFFFCVSFLFPVPSLPSFLSSSPSCLLSSPTPRPILPFY